VKRLSFFKKGGISMEVKISPSIMCANFKNLEKDIKTLEKLNVDYLHLDIMDGHFVPNFTMGLDMLKSIREMTDIPFDIHFMVEKPENYLDVFNSKSNDIVSVHVESTYHLQRVLQKIKDMGARPAVALNPATSLESIKYVLDIVEVVLIMTVNPGFAGQKLVAATLDKIREMNELRRTLNLDIEIEVDGNVSFENAPKMRAAGADIFVTGTSSFFNKDLGIEEAAKKFRKLVCSFDEVIAG
jgi:ribulose-phosphate 3-epimerase